MNNHLTVIETSEQAVCPVCGGAGSIAYSKLRDKMFAASGVWQMRKCYSESCGSLWLDPRPVEHDIAKAYVNYYTHSDEFVPHETMLRHFIMTVRGEFLRHKYGYPGKPANLIQRLVSGLLHLYPLVRTASEFSVMYLPFHPNGNVLEVGCGSGYLLDNLRRMGWKSLKGIDFDSAAVGYARSKGLDVDCGGLEDIVLPDSSFDAVIMSHVIEHLYSPFDVLNRAYSLLKPGGVLVLVTPNSRAFGRKFFGHNWRGLEPPRHLQIFSPVGLQGLCVRAGFLDATWRTTVRGSAGMFAESIAIAKGNVSRGPVVSGLAGRMAGRVLQALEVLMLQLVRDCGEELVIIATKPDNT